MDIQKIRLLNLRYLVNQYGGQKNFANISDIGASQLNHVVGPNPIRNIGEKLARKIESNLKLDRFYLDEIHENTEFKEESEVSGNYRHEIEVVGASKSYKFVNSKPSEIFSTEWARSHDKNPNQIFELVYTLDNMFPYIVRGDILAIDTKDKEPKDSGLYLIILNGNVTVHRVFRQLNNTIVFSNDNKEKAFFRDIVTTTELLNELTIIGSVAALYREI